MGKNRGKIKVNYFTSDLHIGHTNVIKYCSRPFTSVEEMDSILVKNWNDLIKPEDSVYCLGDFSMSFIPVERSLRRLMGNKFLIPGNHDFCHSYHKKSRNPENRARWIKEYERVGWTVLSEQTTLELEGIGTVNVCHHPYGDENSGDSAGYEDKYAKWRPLDDGNVLLCGHIHEKWLTKRSYKGSLMVNCGVDVHNMRPISELELVALIKVN